MNDYREGLNPRVKRLVKLWNEKARSEQDIFSKFVFYYFCFNAIITNLSEEVGDRNALEWTFNNPNLLRDEFIQLLNNDLFSRQIENLRKVGPIPTHRPATARRPNPVSIEDPRSMESVLNFVYQVRCNLFHGRKEPRDHWDQKLVSASSSMFEKLIGNVVSRHCRA